MPTSKSKAKPPAEMVAPETTAANGPRDGMGRFGPGNPGRPKGSRHKLGEAFVSALQADFQQHGVAVIETVRTERPHEYLKVVASLLPKQVEIKDDAFSDVSDEELAALIVAARAALTASDGGGAGASDTTH